MTPTYYRKAANAAFPFERQQEVPGAYEAAYEAADSPSYEDAQSLITTLLAAQNDA